MNIYKYSFKAKCPVNGLLIDYSLTIRTERFVKVEDLIAECNAAESVFHEALADRLLEKFWGEQVMVAHHHGVDIETHRLYRPSMSNVPGY